MRQAVKTNTVPGEFVAFLGYEWTLRRQWGGHHNVFFRKPDSMRVGAQKAPTLTGLYEGLRAKYGTRDVLIIPHAHQAGDWRTNDPEMETYDRDHVDARNLRVVRQLLPPSGSPGGFPCGVRRPPLAARVQLDIEPPAEFLAEPVRRSRGGSGAREDGPTRSSTHSSGAAAYAVTDAQRIILEMDVNGTGMGNRLAYTDRRRLRAKVVGDRPHSQARGDQERRGPCTRSVRSAPRLPATRDSSSGSSPHRSLSSATTPGGTGPGDGTLTVEGAKLASMRTLHFDNSHKEWARIEGEDRNTVRFSTSTRGQADTLLLELEGASPSTTVSFDLDAAREWGKSPTPVRQAAGDRGQAIPCLAQRDDRRVREKGPVRLDRPRRGYRRADRRRHAHGGPNSITRTRAT